MTKTKHSNSEKVVKCPVSGCGAEKLSRAMHLHVLQSSGGGHGPHGDIPENLDMTDLEVVGEKEVKMDYPEDREEEDKARLCPFCGNAFSGYRGVKIHVGQKAGQGVHPEDANEIEKEDCPVAHVDDDMNVINIVDEGAMMPSTKQRIIGETGTVPEEDVIQLIEELKAEGEDDVADRIREALL